MSKLKSLRTEKGLSLRELASELNISYSSLGKYERGEQQPSFETLTKIANYFNVTTDYLIGITNSKFPENRNISDELNLSDEAVNKLKKLPLTISKDNGISLSDILNAVILQSEFESLLENILLYVSRSSDDWNNLESYMNRGSASPIPLHSIKQLDKLLILEKFNNILSNVLDGNISTYNTIQQFDGKITISPPKKFQD